VPPAEKQRATQLHWCFSQWSARNAGIPAPVRWLPLSGFRATRTMMTVKLCKRLSAFCAAQRGLLSHFGRKGRFWTTQCLGASAEESQQECGIHQAEPRACPRPSDWPRRVGRGRAPCTTREGRGSLVGPPGFEPGTKGRGRAFARCVNAHRARGRATGQGWPGRHHAPGTVHCKGGGPTRIRTWNQRIMSPLL
jgi:hypothetical protein